MIPFAENLLKCQLTYSGSKKISELLMMGERGIKKRHKDGKLDIYKPRSEVGPLPHTIYRNELKMYQRPNQKY